MATRREIRSAARTVERTLHKAQPHELAWMKAVLGLNRDIYTETARALGLDPLHVLGAMYITLELPDQ